MLIMRPSKISSLWIIGFALLVGACSHPDAKTNYAVKFCISPSNWGQLESAMRDFGSRYHLEFYGKIEPLSDLKSPAHLHDQLNYALIGGLHEFGGDDFDIWLVSDPSTTDDISLNVLSKHNLTPAEKSTAVDFRRMLEPLTCNAPHRT